MAEAVWWKWRKKCRASMPSFACYSNLPKAFSIIFLWWPWLKREDYLTSMLGGVAFYLVRKINTFQIWEALKALEKRFQALSNVQYTIVKNHTLIPRNFKADQVTVAMAIPPYFRIVISFMDMCVKVLWRCVNSMLFADWNGFLSS